MRKIILKNRRNFTAFFILVTVTGSCVADVVFMGKIHVADAIISVVTATITANILYTLFRQGVIGKKYK
jgi:hypothetical protein